MTTRPSRLSSGHRQWRRRQCNVLCKGIYLTEPDVVLAAPVASAVIKVLDRLVRSFSIADHRREPAYSLTSELARQTAEFIVFSVLTMLARRPDVA